MILFADLALALRIEQAEVRMMKNIVRGASEPGRFAHDLSGGVATFLRLGSPMNKIIGAGIDVPLDVAALEAIERAYGAEPPRVELCTFAASDTGRVLSERGYRLLGFENVLGRTLDGATRAERHRVERVSDIEDFRRISIDGFAAPDDSGVLLDKLTRDVVVTAIDDSLAAGGYDRYVAFVDGVPAGAASLRIDGDIALFAGATTLREFRRRGVQAALFDARLVDAHRRGARFAVITTGIGTQSQANATKDGFSLLYSRAVMIRDGS